MALEDIDIYALTGGGSPIEGVSVGLYDNATKAKLLTSNTDATGKASFAAVDSDLNGGLYEIRVNPGFPGVITGGCRSNCGCFRSSRSSFIKYI